jgi:hypothetical protein
MFKLNTYSCIRDDIIYNESWFHFLRNESATLPRILLAARSIIWWLGGNNRTNEQ